MRVFGCLFQMSRHDRLTSVEFLGDTVVIPKPIALLTDDCVKSSPCKDTSSSHPNSNP